MYNVNSLLLLIEGKLHWMYLENLVILNSYEVSSFHQAYLG